MACLAGSIHIIPIVAAMVLVILNWRGYYIGGELAGAVGQDDAKFIALQFAAKLHELTISASLTTVILSYIRHELIEDTGLPFGAIAAGFQFKDISYLWSMEFWGAVRASWKHTRDKIVLILLIVTCAGLAVSAGPASATLMRPRSDSWPAGGTDFWIALPPDSLYSTNASATQVAASCMIDTGDPGCPSGGWQTIAENYLLFFQFRRRAGYIPDYVHVPGEKAVRTLRAFSRADNFQFTGSQTQATVGSCSVADALVETGRLWAFAAFWWRDQGGGERFWSRSDVTYSVGAQQPVVHARCVAYNASSYAAGNVNTTASTMLVYDLSNPDFFYAHGAFEFLTYKYTDTKDVRSLIQNALNSESAPQVAWSTVPQSDGSALGASLNFPIEGNNASLLIQCTIAARMGPGSLRSTRDNLTIVTGADPANTYNNNNTLPRISIDPAWAEFLNPTISSSNTTAFQYMMRAAGVLDGGFIITPGTYHTFADGLVPIIESILSLSVVNGLARRDFGVGFAGTLLGNADGLDLVDYSFLDDVAVELDSWSCGDWCGQLLPSGAYRMTYGGNAFNISSIERSNSTKLTMNADASGYAYNPRGSAAKFSMFALLLYVFIASSHMGYTLRRWETSNSWDSISELVALAMRSDQSERLVNTGAGIDSFGIFKQRAQVVDKDGRLQLAVGGPVGHYDLVKPNEYYG